MPRDRNVLIGLLLVVCLLQFAVMTDVSVTHMSLCPNKCECLPFFDPPGTGLVINCHARPGIDPQQLYTQIDSLLMGYANSSLTTLNINCSPLSHIPRSLCRLTTLRSLRVSYNHLVELPNNCFIKLDSLLSLWADHNNITYLPNWVFDGLSYVYKLDLTGNQIADLQNGVFDNVGRYCGSHLFTLTLTGNQIASIGTEVFSSKANISIFDLNLDDNQLTSLEPWWHDVNITTKHISIGRNPWDCSCDNKWMSGWLKSIAGRIDDLQAVQCYSPTRLHGKTIIHMTDEEFCVDPAAEATKRAWIISMSSVAAVGVILLSVGVIVYRLRVKLYTRWKFHPFNRDECLGEDMDYDVFLCCSSEDHEPEGRRILETVEANGYSVCYHYRDFMPGLIVANIEASVTRSKRTLCILTGNFLRRFANVFELLTFAR